MAFDSYIGMSIILAIGTGLAYITAPLFWMNNCTAKSRSSIQMFLFNGKIRPICTTVITILSSVLLSSLLFPMHAIDASIIGTIVVVLCLLFQTLGFMTFRIGPFSFAYRDRQLSYNLVKAHDNGDLTFEYMTAAINCIVSEAKKGNVTSHMILEELSKRPDEMGEYVHQVLPNLESPI